MGAGVGAGQSAKSSARRCEAVGKRGAKICVLLFGKFNENVCNTIKTKLNYDKL